MKAVIVRQVLGLALLVVGIIGLFLPFLQGILMIVTGLLILSRDLPFLRQILNTLSRPFPRLAPLIAKAERDVAEFTDGLDGNWGKLKQHPLLLILSAVAVISLILAILHLAGIFRLFG